MAAKKGASKKKVGAVGATPAAPGSTDTATPAAPAVLNTSAPVADTKESKTADLSFAVNVVKLNRAKAYVQKMAPQAKGAEFAGLVKERYVELGGLLTQDKPTAGRRVGKMTGRELNLSDNDGSKD